MTTFKVLGINDPGTSTRYGADDHDKIANMLNGTNIINPVGPINTDFGFRSNKLFFRDLSNGFNIYFLTSAETQSGSITIPTLNGNVTMLLDNDARLYNTRDPNPHSIQHQVGQPDEIPLDQLGAPTDITQNNASSTAHGLAPKLPVDGLLYLDGNGNWTAPSGTGILPDGSITNAKLADNTITAVKIAPGVITDNEVAPAAAIAKTKLAPLAIVDADIASTLSWTKISKTGSKLQDLADVNITGRTDGMILQWNATTSKYDNVTNTGGGGGGTPADNSVSTIKLVNLAVTTAKIADVNVTTAKIADGNVTLAKLASNSVDSSKIVDGSIVNADINSSAAIAWPKISKSGSNIYDLGNVNVSSPTNGQVLTYSGGNWINQTPSIPTSNDSANPVYPNAKCGWIMGGMSTSNDIAGLGGGLFGNAYFENDIICGVDSTGAYSELTTTSTSQTFARIFHQDNNGGPFLGSLNPALYFRVKFPTAANMRIYLGFTEESPVPNNQFTILDNEIGFGFLIDTVNAANWQVVRSNGGSQTLDDWGSAPASNTVYDIVLKTTDGGTTWVATLNGTSRSYTSNTPGSSIAVGFGIMCNTHTSAVRYMRLYYAFCRQDG